ncbi:hypothetical protein QL285_082216 [Trifolium repens]|nr:hypothetical protein QL285_082216 [Trifolium repens]
MSLSNTSKMLNFIFFRQGSYLIIGIGLVMEKVIQSCLQKLIKKKSAQEGHSSHHSRFLNMVYDAVGPQHQMECEEEMEESPNINDQSFTTYYMRHRNNCGLDATITQNCLLPLDY